MINFIQGSKEEEIWIQVCSTAVRGYTTFGKGPSFVSTDAAQIADDAVLEYRQRAKKVKGPGGFMTDNGFTEM